MLYCLVSIPLRSIASPPAAASVAAWYYPVACTPYPYADSDDCARTTAAPWSLGASEARGVTAATVGQTPACLRASRAQSKSSPGSRLRVGASSAWPTTRHGGAGRRRRLVAPRALGGRLG